MISLLQFWFLVWWFEKSFISVDFRKEATIMGGENWSTNIKKWFHFRKQYIVAYFDKRWGSDELRYWE